MKHKFIVASFLLSVTTPAFAGDTRHSDKMMQHLDQDGDGLVSFDEFRGPGGKMFTRADTDGDGAVTQAEMSAHRDQMMSDRRAEREERMERHRARMDEMFAAMDADGDGAVTQEEARAAAFSRMDGNGDGVLSADELKRPHDRHDGRHSGRHRDAQMQKNERGQ